VTVTDSTDLIDLLTWDSTHFGFTVARVRQPSDPERIRAAADAADRQDVRCLTALIPADRTATVTAAEEAGFRCYDVRMELGRSVPTEPGPRDQEGIRPAEADDLSSLMPIARERFVDSRFSVDPNFSDDLVGELYVEWLRRGLRAENRLLLKTPERDGFVVLCLESETKIGVIELIAVASGSEGLGLGDSLVDGAEAAVRDAGLSHVRVVTQGANFAAQRLYQRHGYRTMDVALWLHRWASNP